MGQYQYHCQLIPPPTRSFSPSRGSARRVCCAHSASMSAAVRLGEQDLTSLTSLLHDKRHSQQTAAAAHWRSKASSGCSRATQRYLFLAALLTVVLVLLGALASSQSSLHSLAGREPIDLTSLLDDDTREASAIVRLDEHGVYAHFHTVSLIMKPRTQATLEAYQRVHAVLRDHSHILAPLPPASYHVTLSGIFDRRRSPTLDRHNALISSEHERLERAKFAFTSLGDSGSLTFRVIGIQDWLVGVALLMQPKGLEDMRRLTRLAELANSTLGPLYRHERWWHSSLAYFIPQRDIQQSELAELRVKLMAIVGSVDIEVDGPRICNTRQFGSCDFV